MNSFMAFVIIVWAQANPAARSDRSAVIWKETFPDKQICEVALDEQKQRAQKTYGGIKSVTVIGYCVSAQSEGA